MSPLISALRAAPVTSGLLLFSILGFALLYLRAPYGWLSALTFTPFSLRGDEVSFGEASGQYWRLVTPVFLHFGWLHIVFNGLWTWELGRAVERELGSVELFFLFILIAVISNTCQYLFGGPGIFGGMSGVVYGLLGFSWVAARLHPAWRFRPLPGIMVFMIGWLVICVFGLVQVLGFGAIANAAHVGGLISGALLGFLAGLLARTVGK